jgi:hypothetical protein
MTEEEYRGPERRSQCEAHINTMKEIFEKIERRLPIWVFLTSLGIISAAFTFVATVNRDGNSTLSKKVDEVAADVKALSTNLHDLNISQAVLLFRLEDLTKKHEKGP